MMSESVADLQELGKLSPAKRRAVKNNTERNRNVEKWKIILEPALIGSMIAINLGQTSLQNFYLRTACTVDLGYSSEICDKGVGEAFRSVEAESQMVVSGVNVSRSFIGSLIATIVLLFVGPWSDFSGRRKPVLMLPLIGMSVMTTGVLLMLTFPGATTAQVLYAVQIPMSLGGNFGLLLAAAFSHVGDVCHATGRDVTRTMGTHRAAIQIAHVVGSISGPLLYRNLGFYGVFPIVLLFQLSSLAYVVFKMEDVNVNTENQVSVYNWKLPFNAVHCLVRKREGYRRPIILLMLVIALGDRMVLSAEVLTSYMYYRFKFNWDDVLFGSFLAYKNMVSFAGTVVILTVLKKRLSLPDEVVGALSGLSYILATGGLIAATKTLVVFTLPLVGFISQGSQVVQRPLLNKQILPNEQGKIYSVLGALESATQTFSSPLYSLLYSKTVSTLPDAWLIPGIILVCIQIISYLSAKVLINKTTYDDQIKKNVSLKLLSSNVDLEKSQNDSDNVLENKNRDKL